MGARCLQTPTRPPRGDACAGSLPRTSTSPPSNAQLPQIRQLGYALNARPDDVTSLAMTVEDPRGATITAISAAGPSTRIAQQGQKQIARRLHAAAAQYALLPNECRCPPGRSAGRASTVFT
ncbi:IclR family transcriptional regulator domain-containing protein [Pseudarthrobacter phenanthrenivorans]|uniref:IclR family transcriptional regulator domain-containing protein n=1 Tax=Pseudarthrobacter phenanthrenivorans TaxID=361575 RepID=UPI0039089B6B